MAVPRLPNTSPQTLRVLELLLAEASDASTWCYGYDLSRRTGLKSGTLYPILVRLAEQGWLETSWAAAQAAGRPPRHIYRLTAEGARAAVLALADQTSGRVMLRARPGEAGG